MSLASFQRALCDLIASPALCLAVRADAEAALVGYELSARELKRLATVVWQRGMSTNCTLYRSNRITPIYTLLHYTCRALGPQLGTLIDEFWTVLNYKDGQFKSEIERFGAFLRERITSGAVASPYVEDVLAFELARNELEFGPRRSVLRAVAQLPPPERNQPCRLHPLARLVRFRHDPEAIFAALVAGAVPPPNLLEEEAFIVLSVVEGDLKVLRLGEGASCVDDKKLSCPTWPAARVVPELADLLLPLVCRERGENSGDRRLAND
jgi:hypothetical protein